MKTKKIILVALLFGLCTALHAQTFTHPWSGKRVAFIGDSVSDPNLKKGENMKHYWDFLSEWLGIKPMVYAVSGHTLKNGLQNIDRLHNEHGNEVDAIMVFLGTNDFNSALPMGTLYIRQETEVERAVGYPRRKEHSVQRTFSMNDKTICGRINLIMHKLKSLYPDKQIVFLTPLHRGYAEFGDSNVQPDESYSNAQGNYIDEVARAITEAGRAWSIPVIDLYSLCGLLPTMPEQGSYIFNPERDRLHPNEQGHERIARTLMQQTLVLPVF